MKKYLLFFVCSLVLVLSGCESKKENIAFDYYKDKDNVYIKYRKEWSFAYVYQKIENANPETFEVLNKNISKDKDSIFIMFNPIIGVDHDTFSVYGESNYAKDKDNIYFIDWKDLNEPVKIIKDVDRNSFEFVQEKISTADYYAKDKNKVFLNEKVLEGVSSDKFEIINEFYFKDKNGVFGSFNHKLKNADPNTFEIIKIKADDKYYESSYSRDKNNVYCYNHEYIFNEGRDIITEADLETFEAISFDDAKDKNHSYKECDVVN